MLEMDELGLFFLKGEKKPCFPVNKNPLNVSDSLVRQASHVLQLPGAQMKAAQLFQAQPQPSLCSRTRLLRVPSFQTLLMQ